MYLTITKYTRPIPVAENSTTTRQPLIRGSIPGMATAGGRYLPQEQSGHYVNITTEFHLASRLITHRSIPHLLHTQPLNST